MTPLISCQALLAAVWKLSLRFMVAAKPPWAPISWGKLFIMELADALLYLDPFLTQNPSASLEEHEYVGGKGLAIKKPWGDESLVLNVPDDLRPLADALEKVYLPERFTAIWHRDTKDLEIIWTASKLADSWKEIEGRQFDFIRAGRTYKCEFGESSEQLITIASHFVPITSSATNYRNLISYRMWVEEQKEENDRAKLVGKPRSFWIRAIEWNEDEVLDTVRHLNFYMSYYDHISPQIVVHAPKTEAAMERRSRYIHGAYPSKIDSKQLDDFMLLTWAASQEGDAARKFLYAYRAIEFASFSYLESNIRADVRKILSAPHALDDIRRVSDAVAAALQKSKWDDVAKFTAVVTDIVDPSLIWKEINRNMSAFTTETHFDGGFVLQRLLAPGCREQDLSLNQVARFLREIRNALAHGKDQKSAAVIAPTTRTFELLTPWAAVASIAAGEIILYRDVV